MLPKVIPRERQASPKQIKHEYALHNQTLEQVQSTWILVFLTIWIFLLVIQRPLVFTAGTFLWHLEKPTKLHTKRLCIPSWNTQS